MNILVSVNCITYNHEKYIGQAIESFLMQKTNFDYEILIGEDCSTDDTRKIINKYVEKYPDKIKLITSEKNVGARNNSLRLRENSLGKYIAACEGDDYWSDPYKLQKQIDYMENNPECSLICHNVEVLDDETKEIVEVIGCNENKIYHTDDVILYGGDFIYTQSIVFRKETMDNPPAWYSTALVGDYPLQMIVASQGYVYYMKDIMAVYRTNVNGSWTDVHFKKNITKEKLILSRQGILDILNNFNQYTNYKYSESVDKASIPLEFEMCMLKGETKSRYENRYKEYYSNLSSKWKIKSYFKGCFPDFYIKLLVIKANLKRKYKNLVRRKKCKECLH